VVGLLLWLSGYFLRVEIFDSSGNCVYSNSNSGEPFAQVTIIQHCAGVETVSGIKVLRRSYFVLPGNLCFGLLDRDNFNDIPLVHIFSSERCEWDRILDRAFGGAADVLLHPKNAARLAEFLSSGFQPSHTRPRMELLNS
jgi:hypothetical protein